MHQLSIQPCQGLPYSCQLWISTIPFCRYSQHFQSFVNFDANVQLVVISYSAFWCFLDYHKSSENCFIIIFHYLLKSVYWVQIMPGFNFFDHLHGVLRDKVSILPFDLLMGRPMALNRKRLGIYSSLLNQADVNSIYHNIHWGLYSFLCFISAGMVESNLIQHFNVVYSLSK